MHQLSYGLVTLDILYGDMSSQLDQSFDSAQAEASIRYDLESMPFYLSDRKEYLASAVCGFLVYYIIQQTIFKIGIDSI